jgi:hypothetical protein
MPTVLLVITLFTASVTATQNTVVLVRTFKALHHHSTKPLYKHVLKPVAKAVKRVAE